MSGRRGWTPLALALGLQAGLILSLAGSPVAVTGGGTAQGAGFVNGTAPGTGIPPTSGAGAGLTGDLGAPSQQSGAGSAGQPAAAPGSAGQPGTPGAVANAGSDRSHCTSDGRQFAGLYHAPPCVATWPKGAANGGATAPGVDAKTIRVVMYQEASIEVVNSLLLSQGIGYTQEEFDAFAKAAEKFINERYELYGRKVVVEVHRGSCQTSPPDNPCFREEARKLAKRAFMVLHVSPLPTSFFEELTRSRTVSIGGWNAAGVTFQRGRPYRWDFLTDGTTASRLIAESACKRLAGRPAAFSGATIHSSIGARGQVQRHFGILVPDDPAAVPNAEVLSQALVACGAKKPAVIRYQQDQTRAQEQASTTMAGLISAKVTTVITLGDPIFPVFFTSAATQQAYYPEWFISGAQGIDYDVVGRLYDSAQWRHSFGLGQQGQLGPPERRDSTVVWRAAGNSSPPDGSLSLEIHWQYYSLAATMLQLAGPAPTASSIYTAMNGYKRGGWSQARRADVPLWDFSANDLTATGDVREMYWDPAATSTADGKRGAYRSLDSGRRYGPGQLPGGEPPVPVTGL